MSSPADFNYRPEIDGLRAVAVAAVIGFHAFPKAIPGGYVGVDVFFVISGFLITSIIVGKLAKGRFSLADFYIRRTRRIFPALTLVLAVCLAAGWVLLLPSEFVALGKHAAAGATFITNFVQRLEAGYFDLSAELKPLLHLWSLGIEEQFYVAWPLVAMLAFRFGKRVFAAALAIVVISFTINMTLTYKNSIVSAFYLPWSRAWELLLGGCLATAPRIIGYDVARLRSAAAVLGATLIGVAIAFFDHNSAFPGWRALLPTVGTALIIWAGPAAWLNRQLLARPMLVGVGLFSYPLYLWHWPLLSFLAINDDRSIVSRIVAVALAIALAWATYRWLELPIRRAGRVVWRPLAASLAGVAVVALAAYAAILPANSSAPELAAIEHAQGDFVYPTGTPVAFEDQVFYRDGDAPKSVLFFGDSNMQQYYPRIHSQIERGEGKLSAIYATHGGCAPIPSVTGPIDECPRFASQTYKFAEEGTVTTVVIAAQWNGYFSSGTYFYHESSLALAPGRSMALAALQDTLEHLVQSGKTVYLVLNIPIGHAFAPQSRLKRTFLGVELAQVPTVNRADFPVGYEDIANDLKRVAKNAGAIPIDPFEWLCNTKTCEVADSAGAPIYKDGVHLRASFVRDHVQYIDHVFDDNKIHRHGRAIN